MAEQNAFIARYPGVVSLEAASYVDTRGITPSVASLQILPQDITRISLTGNLELRQGDVVRTLKGCKVMKISLDLTKSGHNISLAILDRRWKWAFGSISGYYNVRDDKAGDEQQIDPDTEKTPRELATLLCEAMGEDGFSVAALPNDARPLVQWEAARPAEELANLCELLNCAIVRDLEDRLVIVRNGEGADLPYLRNEEQDEVGLDPPESPDDVEVKTGKKRFQVDLRIEPYGVDVDGEYMPLNDLSFAPEDGWGRSIGPPFFAGVSIDGVGSSFLEELARKWCYRLFRITLATPQGEGSTDDPMLEVPGSDLGIIENLWQILIEDKQVELTTDAQGGSIAKPAEIRGSFWNGGQSYTNETFPTAYRGNFQIIDREKGLILFDQYVWKYTAEGEKDRPELILRCACNLRDKDTRAWVRQSLMGAVREEDRLGTKPITLLHEEIIPQVYPEYDAEGYPTDVVIDNKEKIEEEMAYYIDAARAANVTTQTRTRQWPGLVPIALDGLIHQVSYTLNKSGCVTQASRNTEHNLAVPSYQERRMWERLREVQRG